MTQRYRTVTLEGGYEKRMNDVLKLIPVWPSNELQPLVKSEQRGKVEIGQKFQLVKDQLNEHPVDNHLLYVIKSCTFLSNIIRAQEKQIKQSFDLDNFPDEMRGGKTSHFLNFKHSR